MNADVWRMDTCQKPPFHAVPRSSAATGSPSHARAALTPRPPTRTCSRRRSTASSRASASRASASATSSRECVLGSSLDHATPAHDVQQACDTGLQAALAVAQKIALGQIDAGVAGGVDTTSDAPVALNDDLRRVLMKVSQAKSVADRVRLVGHLRPGQIVPDIPRNAEPRTGLSMGEHQARTTRQWEISREEQDELAAASHVRAAAAYERGFFDDLVTPFLGLERDENMRPDSDVEKLAKLKPVFGKGDGATMTAGNSTPLSDGAATVLLASDEWAAERGLPVLAHITHCEVAAVDYINGDD